MTQAPVDPNASCLFGDVQSLCDRPVIELLDDSKNHGVSFRLTELFECGPQVLPPIGDFEHLVDAVTGLSLEFGHPKAEFLDHLLLHSLLALEVLDFATGDTVKPGPDRLARHLVLVPFLVCDSESFGNKIEGYLRVKSASVAIFE